MECSIFISQPAQLLWVEAGHVRGLLLTLKEVYPDATMWAVSWPVSITAAEETAKRERVAYGLTDRRLVKERIGFR
jgi:hypothetical protein